MPKKEIIKLSSLKQGGDKPGTGQFLGQHYKETNTDQWPEIFVSSYMRPMQTLRGILHGMDGAIVGKPKLREDIRLIEKFFGATNFLEHPDLVPGLDLDFAKNLQRLSKAVHEKDPFVTPNLLGESSKNTMNNVDHFKHTIQTDIKEGKKDFLCVNHGAIIQGFVMSWFHLPMSAKHKIDNPNNGDVIAIEGTPKNWTVRKIYDGKEMRPVNEPVIGHIKLLDVDDLPPLPGFLLEK